MKKKDNQQKSNVQFVDYVVFKSGDKELFEICSHPTRPTHVVKELHISGKLITHKAFSHISKVQWCNLTDLNINNNRIDNKSCKYLSKTKMPKIRHLNLWQNLIGSTGVYHLSKAAWLDLRQLKMSATKLGLSSFQSLVRADWPKILAIAFKRQVNEGRCYLTIQQVLRLVLNEISELNYIYLFNIFKQSEQKTLYTLLGKEEKGFQIKF